MATAFGSLDQADVVTHNWCRAWLYQISSGLLRSISRGVESHSIDRLLGRFFGRLWFAIQFGGIARGVSGDAELWKCRRRKGLFVDSHADSQQWRCDGIVRQCERGGV